MEETLFGQIVKSTGLPEDLISQDFLRLIQDKGLDQNTLTIDQIRDILTEYLQDVILTVRENYK